MFYANARLLLSTTSVQVIVSSFSDYCSVETGIIPPSFFLNNDVTFAIFQSSGTTSESTGLWKIMARAFTSLSNLGCIPSKPGDLSAANLSSISSVTIFNSSRISTTSFLEIQNACSSLAPQPVPLPPWIVDVLLGLWSVPPWDVFFLYSTLF